MTENKYVIGYLAYWDELLRRHPGMLIDSCASGGRRNDLETMRRAVPLLRSDYLFEPVGQQGHTYGLSFWLPFYGTGYCPSNTVGWGWGTGGVSYDPYTRRSNMCPANTACFDFRVDVDDCVDSEALPRMAGGRPGLLRRLLSADRPQPGSRAPGSPGNSIGPKPAGGWFRRFAGRTAISTAASSGCEGFVPDAQYEVVNFDEPGNTETDRPTAHGDRHRNRHPSSAQAPRSSSTSALSSRHMPDCRQLSHSPNPWC